MICEVRLHTKLVNSNHLTFLYVTSQAKAAYQLVVYNLSRLIIVPIPPAYPLGTRAVTTMEVTKAKRIIYHI
jgi:hypothetical protein